MSLRIVARPLGGDKYSLGIAGSFFGNESGQDPTGKTLSVKREWGASYPADLRYDGVSGTVYVLLRVNRSGRVDEAVAEQVNLDVAGSEAKMRYWRKTMADAALRATRDWQFSLPTSGPDAAGPYWAARVQFTFGLRRTSGSVEKYGTWHAYVPGPRDIPAWSDEPRLGGSADAVAAGGVVEIGQGLRLTTPLNGG